MTKTAFLMLVLVMSVMAFVGAELDVEEVEQEVEENVKRCVGYGRVCSMDPCCGGFNCKFNGNAMVCQM